MFMHTSQVSWLFPLFMLPDRIFRHYCRVGKVTSNSADFTVREIIVSILGRVVSGKRRLSAALLPAKVRNTWVRYGEKVETSLHFLMLAIVFQNICINSSSSQ